MENDPHSKRGRLMGKLFGRDRKSTNQELSTPADLNDFFRGSSDNLPVSHPAPPTLARLDTSGATRYPNSADINPPRQSLTLQQRSYTVRGRSRKGLVVRFADTFPDIIGDGGDECDIPTLEITKRKRAQKPPVPPPPQRAPQPAAQSRPSPETKQAEFVPAPIKRTQTGYSEASNIVEDDVPSLPAGTPTASRFLDSPIVSTDEKRKSFIELQQAAMREAEGMAFAQAVRSASTAPEQEGEESKSSAAAPVAEPPIAASQRRQTASPEARVKTANSEQQSPASVHSTASSYAQRWAAARQNSKLSEQDSASPQKATSKLHDVVLAAGDEALDVFQARTRHLFELFRLQAETVRPLHASTPDDLARASLWWFLTGRMGLEATIRGNPSSPQDEQQIELARQQAYADLSKALWISEEVLPEVSESMQSPTDKEVQEVRQALISGLKKLALSMKRNGYLPPEEAFLPQIIDKTIWLEYPSLSQDIIALLRGFWGSALAAPQQPATSKHLLETLPLGDTTELFSFGRFPVDAYLMEQGREAQQFYFSCFLSVVRPPSQPSLEICITSQNGSVQLRVQEDRNAGATWEDVKWRSEKSALEIKLPRGFMLAVQCAPQDYKFLWDMQDFSAKVQSTLYPWKDEQTVFRATLRSFQYFDADSQSLQFPKDPVRNCEVGLFERTLREGAAQGPRHFHRGFRLAVITGPKTRNLSGINHSFSPQIPVEFGFLRGEQDDPALLLKFTNARSHGRMVFSFQNDAERLRMHNILIGTALHSDENVYAEVPLTGFTVAQRMGDREGIASLARLGLSRAMVINADQISDASPTVLAEKLRIVLDSPSGSLTDRINVGPGEFKLRLNVKEKHILTVLRQPQQDLTVALSESQIPRELAPELTEALQILRTSPTVRTYKFASLQDLHTFQAALTGYDVLFDGIASAFAIARRRMVVPIHKKWEAGATRVQIVQKGSQTQLLVFFEDFHHGQSMSFALKGTDVYETFGRGSKLGVKFDDAKFPLPRTPEDGGPDDTAFVCLDLPELPGEHDDISILFDNEADREKLCSCLPAPVKGSKLLKR